MKKLSYLFFLLFSSIIFADNRIDSNHLLVTETKDKNIQDYLLTGKIKTGYEYKIYEYLKRFADTHDIKIIEQLALENNPDANFMMGYLLIQKKEFSTAYDYLDSANNIFSYMQYRDVHFLELDKNTGGTETACMITENHINHTSYELRKRDFYKYCIYGEPFQSSGNLFSTEEEKKSAPEWQFANTFLLDEYINNYLENRILPKEFKEQSQIFSFLSIISENPYNIEIINFLNKNSNDIGQLLTGYIFYSQGDYEKAKEWFEKSAKKNNPFAENRLGEMYILGLGVKRDFNKAEYWLKRASKHNYIWANYILAIISVDRNPQLFKHNAGGIYQFSYPNLWSLGNLNLTQLKNSCYYIKRTRYDESEKFYKEVCQEFPKLLKEYPDYLRLINKR